MMESIHESDRVRRLERALLVIEGLTLLKVEEGKQTDFSDRVYQIAHSALGFCGATKHHDREWLGEIEKMEGVLKKLNILDVERELNERKSLT